MSVAGLLTIFWMTRALLSALAIVSGLGIANAATFSVTSTADSGAGTLRQAITDANNAAGADTIAFNISGASVHTITLSRLCLSSLIKW